MALQVKAVKGCGSERDGVLAQIVQHPDSTRGFCLKAEELQEITNLCSEILETVGMLPAILQLSIPNGEKRSKHFQLAQASADRGTLAVKRLLWKVHGICKFAAQEKALLPAQEIQEAVQVAAREGIVNEAGG